MPVSFIDRILHRLGDRDTGDLLKGSFISFLWYGFGKILAFVFVFVCIRTYGKTNYGYIALALTLMQVFSLIGKIGFHGVVLRFVSQYSSQNQWGKVRKIYLDSVRFSFPFSVIFSAVYYFSAPALANFFGDVELIPYFQLFALAVLPHALYQVVIEGLRGLKKNSLYSFYLNASIILFAIVMLLLFIAMSDNELNAAIAYVLAIFIACIFAFYSFARTTHLFSQPTEPAMSAREIFSISLPMMLSGSLLFVISWTDNIMLGRFRTEDEVGIYDIAFRIAVLAGSTLMSVNVVNAPRFAEYYGKGDMKSLSDSVTRSSKLIFWTSLPIMLICLIFPRFLLSVFDKDAMAASTALVILVIGKFISAICGPVGNIMHMTGKQKQFQFIMLFAAVVNIILNLILTPRYGMTGAATASMVSIVLWNVITAFVVHHYYGFYPFYFPFSDKIFSGKQKPN